MTTKPTITKSLQYFEIRVETTLPATLTYRVLAEDAIKASDMIKNMPPTNVKYKLFGKKDIKLTVYKSGCSVIEFMKNLVR